MTSVVVPSMGDFWIVANHAREEEREQYRAVTGHDWIPDKIAFESFDKAGVKFVLRDDNGNPVCVGGWEPLIDGVFESWMMGTDEGWKKHWRGITKVSKKVISALMREPTTRRLQIHSLESRANACSWFIRGLNFRHESTMQGYGVGGENLAVYVRMREI